MRKSGGSSSDEVPSYALPLHTLLHNRYLIVEMLGSGGFGITYLARDKMLNRTVAIKEFFIQQTMFRDHTIALAVTVSRATESQERVYRISRRKFIDEARTLANLEHVPGIVRVYDLFEENKTAYMVMEYLPGMTLKSFIKKHGQISFSDILQRMNPLLDSLYELHRHEIFHRDISPDNIMMSENGSLVLFDFGGAKISNSDSESSIILVKSGYSPLEQFQVGGAVGPWIDIYALAATIYYCITGVVPPESIKRVNSPNLMKRPSELGAALDKEQENVLLKAMALRHGERYQTIPEFKQALNNRQNSRKRKGNIACLIIGIVTAVLVAVAAGFVLKSHFEKKLLENEPGDMMEERLSESESEMMSEKGFSENEPDAETDKGLPESETSGAMTEEQFPENEPGIMTEEGRPEYEVIEDYNKEIISYEEAAQELSGREEWMERLDSLKQSKEAYQKGNSAMRDGKIQEALEWYEKVIGADSNYTDARKQMDEIRQ